MRRRGHILWTLLAVAILLPRFSTAAPRPADPACYIKGNDWHETLLASRQRLLASETASPRKMPTWVSPVIRGGEPAQIVSLPIAGQTELYLFVFGAPEVIYGAATWADAKLIGKEGKAISLSDLKSVKVLEGQHSLNVNLKSGVSGPLSINGKHFDKGLHVYPNARSKVHVPLDRAFERFEASIGIDDWVGQHGAVRFVITDAQGAARYDLWELVARDFADGASRRQMKWEREDQILDADWNADDFADLASRYARAAGRVPALAQQAQALAAAARTRDDLGRVRTLYYRSRELDEAVGKVSRIDPEGLRLAIQDLIDSFGNRYPQGPAFLAKLKQLESNLRPAAAQSKTNDLKSVEQLNRIVLDIENLRREALLANPLLDFDRLLLIQRKPDGDPRMPHGTGFSLGEFLGLPRQSSKHNPDIERYFGWENELAVLSPVRPEGKLTTLYKPDKPQLINDVDLHWNAERMMFSMPGTNAKWHVFELNADGSNLHQVTPANQPDVHYYDPCYLPNGRTAFLSTACFQGVPCNAGVIVGMMYTMKGDGSDICQICFEQDHDYCPTVTNDGRLLYLRWDYTDTPHVWNRMLFTCNPDGTNQAEYYGANSYWPNAIFYAKPIPNHPSKVVGIVTGHHVGRVGELVVFDPAKSQFEADGVVQRIPGRGQKVEPLIEDKLTEHSWPKFLHPQPLSEKYFIVSAKPTPDSLWGIYLVDVFDNMVLLKEVEGQALLEPIPLRKTPMPPVIPDRVKPEQTEGTVYLANVYDGPGLKDVPPGTIKKLRVVNYHFAYQRIAGIDHRVGADGPWEVKRVLGTVDVEPDGSALFRVPAKMPITVQPLDAEGKAVQLMRSWMTAMPGETLSCGGCHDNRIGVPPTQHTRAQSRPAQTIAPWHGPARGFSFEREVQPVLDKYCVACHEGKPDAEGKSPVDLRREQGYFICYKGGDPKAQIVRDAPRAQLLGKFGGIFDPSYIALRRLVRVGGLESDLHLLPPMEFSADTSELIQMLKKGHHNVKLDAEAWDRLYTWIDLNAPCHGTWSELVLVKGGQRDRRKELQQLYCGRLDDPEGFIPPAIKVEPIRPEPMPKASAAAPVCEGWPFDAAEARRRQNAAGATTQKIDPGNGIALELVRIPAGQFVMGHPAGCSDEQPASVARIDRAFWMGRFEITNAQFKAFDPGHDSRFEHRSSWIFSEDYLGWPLNKPEQPVVRISWDQAMSYCRWLSAKTGKSFSLPTEAQWEYACRAGTALPLSFGDTRADFSTFANLADYNIRDQAYQGWRPQSPDLLPREDRFNDGYFVSAEVGRFKPNAWGLHDMHGNAAEWTRSMYKPYPWDDADGRNDPAPRGLKVVRGGSWYDRPARCTSAFRLAYPPYQRVYNVGFRVVVEDSR